MLERDALCFFFACSDRDVKDSDLRPERLDADMRRSPNVDDGVANPEWRHTFPSFRGGVEPSGLAKLRLKPTSCSSPGGQGAPAKLRAIKAKSALVDSGGIS